MKKRILATMLCLTMAAGLLAGCGSKGSAPAKEETPAETTAQKEESAPAATAAEEQAAEETAAEETTEAAAEEYVMNTDPITITIMDRAPESFSYEDNQVLDKIAEITGVTLAYEIPPMSNYTERLQVVMAADEMCDVSYTWGFGATTYQKWAEDGLIWDVTDMIGDYPNLMANIPQNQWDAARCEDGRIYAVPKPHQDSVYGIGINTDWLNKLVDGKVPANLEELEAFGKLVAESDPDANGQKDTFLFSPPGVWGDGWIVQAFMPYVGGSVLPKLPDFDGEYKIRQKMDGYLPYLRWFRDMYAQGLIDPEFFTNNTYDDRTKFQQNRTAICALTVGQNITTSLVNGMVGEDVDPDLFSQYITLAPCMKPDGQDKANVEQSASNWGGWMISANVDEETVRRILGFLDWANTEEGWLMMNGGVQGHNYDTYDPETKTVTKTQEEREFDKEINSYASMASGLGGIMLQSVTAGDEISLKRAVYNTNELKDFLTTVNVVSVPSISFPAYTQFTADNPDLVDRLTNMEENFVTGNIDEAAFTSFLEDEWFPAIAPAEEEYLQTMNEYAASAQ